MRRFALALMVVGSLAAFTAGPALADCGGCDASACSKASACSRTATACSESECDRPKDIVATAVKAGQFKTLAAALTAADLVETLQGRGPFTVFAPTDEAFGKLPEGTLGELLKPENKRRLAAILTYHVVPGKVMAADVVKLSKAKTAQGSEVKIKLKDGKVLVDNATVTATDIACSNGVIHVISDVILPN